MHHKRRGTTIALLTAAALLQAGCAPGPAVLEQSLPGRCAWLGGVRQELRLPLEVTRPGLLRIDVRERGITAAAALELTARLNASAGSTAGRTTLRSATAASPVERFGTLTLVGESSGSAAATVHVWSRDSAAIVAQVCVAAQLLRPDSATARTARLQAQADARAQARDWQGAFEAERAAARLAATSSEAATARHTMAQLEYGALDRKADSIPVISASLAEDAQTDRTVTGARLELLAKALAERTTLREVPVARVRALIAAAAARFATDPLAQRELPRLTTLQSFLEYRLGDVDAAYRLSSRAADQCRSLGDGECFARARQNMAAIAEQRQNFPAALAFYREALGAIDPSRYPQLAANIFDNLGRLEDLAGLYSNSEQAQRRALQGYVAMGRCEGVRRSAARLGSMLMDVGSLADAAGYLVPIVSQSCDTLLHELAAADPSSVPALDLAVSASGPRSLRPRLPDPSAACRREQHLEDLSFESNRAVFRALLSLSQIAALEGRLTGATACLQAARGYAVDAPMRGELAHARGLLLLQLQQPRAAREEFSTALQLSLSSELEGSTELGLARAALMLKDAGEARLHAYRALELGCRRADVSEIASALQALAAVESLSADHAGATQTLRMALGLIEQVPLEGLDAERRALYLSTQHELFADLTDQLAAEALGSQASSEALWRAFGSAEEGHARSLRFALRQASQEQLVAGSALLKAARAPARNDSGRYEQLMQTLAGLRPGDSPAGAARLLEALKLLQGPASLQSGLDRAALEAQLQRLGAVLVEYAAGVHDLYGFVADGHGLRLLRLGDRERIAASATQLGEALRANQTEAAAIAPAARALADQVLVPLQPYLDRKRVILVPDDALHTIPFALLPWRSPGAMELLVQHVQLSMLPAASMLSDSQPPASTGQRFVLLGDPVFRRLQWERTCQGERLDAPVALGTPAASSVRSQEPVPASARSAFDWARDLPSLPGSRAEVLAIATIIHQASTRADVRLLLGCAATPDALRSAAPTAALLHIATHGMVDAERPRLSALALTPASANAEDSAFRLLDVLGMPLHARLVVLSACDTSRGRLLPGEGVLGLAQAFLQAGARSVLASYWRVDDAATTALMQQLYRHLLLEHLPVAEALQRTQIEFARQSPSYAWAAFGLYGRPDLQL